MAESSAPRQRQPTFSPPPEGAEAASVDLASLFERLRTRLTTVKGWTQLAERQASAGTSPLLLVPYLQRTLQAVIEMQSTIDRAAGNGPSRDSSWPPENRVSERVRSRDQRSTFQ